MRKLLIAVWIIAACLASFAQSSGGNKVTTGQTNIFSRPQTLNSGISAGSPNTSSYGRPVVGFDVSDTLAMTLRNGLATGTGSVICVGDSICGGTGSSGGSGYNGSWFSLVVEAARDSVGGYNPSTNYSSGVGFVPSDPTNGQANSSTGTWTVLQGVGPSQSVGTTFGLVKTGATGATYTTTYGGTNVDVLFYQTSATTGTSCNVNIDSTGAVNVPMSAQSTPTPYLYSVTGLGKNTLHTVVVTSADGNCSFMGVNFRGTTGITGWNVARSGATSGAFYTPSSWPAGGTTNTQMNWLSVVPNPILMVIEIGQNDPGVFTQAQSLTNIAGIIAANNALTNPIPMVFVFPESPQSDSGQGVLYAAVRSTILSAANTPYVDIYDRWGANSYVTYPGLYADSIHPSQAGQCDIGRAVSQYLQLQGGDCFPSLHFSGIMGGLYARDTYGDPEIPVARISSTTVALGGSGVGGVSLTTGGSGGNGTPLNVTSAGAVTEFTLPPYVRVSSSDFTTANNTNLQAITGLNWTMPASTAMNLPFACYIEYSQGTGNAAVAFGVQDVTVAPTSGNFSGVIWTSATTPTSGTLNSLASTTATSVVSATPGATATVFRAELEGMIEQPSNGSTSVFQIMVSTATGTDPVTVKRGSYCKLGLF